VEHSPQLRNVSGKGDISVENNDSLQVGRECLGQYKLHKAINPRVVFVGDPGHFRLDREGEKGHWKKEKKLITLILCLNAINHA
jgi:hypothetical protein